MKKEEIEACVVAGFIITILCYFMPIIMTIFMIFMGFFLTSMLSGIEKKKEKGLAVFLFFCGALFGVVICQIQSYARCGFFDREIFNEVQVILFFLGVGSQVVWNLFVTSKQRKSAAE